jgi:hypothetical protein
VVAATHPGCASRLTLRHALACSSARQYAGGKRQAGTRLPQPEYCSGVWSVLSFQSATPAPLERPCHGPPSIHGGRRSDAGLPVITLRRLRPPLCSFGARGRVRTCDVLLRRQMLYPLSYAGGVRPARRPPARAVGRDSISRHRVRRTTRRVVGTHPPRSRLPNSHTPFNGTSCALSPPKVSQCVPVCSRLTENGSMPLDRREYARACDVQHKRT